MVAIAAEVVTVEDVEVVRTPLVICSLVNDVGSVRSVLPLPVTMAREVERAAVVGAGEDADVVVIISDKGVVTAL